MNVLINGNFLSKYMGTEFMTYRCSEEHHEPLEVNQCVAPLAIKCYFCGDRTRNGLRYDGNCGRNVICPIVNRIMFIHRHELWIYPTAPARVFMRWECAKICRFCGVGGSCTIRCLHTILSIYNFFSKYRN